LNGSYIACFTGLGYKKESLRTERIEKQANDLLFILFGYLACIAFQSIFINFVNHFQNTIIA